MSTPPGWYPDPQQPGFVRWWDGSTWTQHANPAGTSQQAQSSWYGAQPAAWAGQPATYGAPPATGWVTPSGPSQWGATPTVYYAPGKKRGKRFWWGLGICLTAVILAAGGGFGWLVVNAIQAIQAPQHEADSYLADLTSGRYGQAYARLCAIDTARVSLAQFSLAKAARHPVSYRIYHTGVVSSGGLRTATVEFDETTSDGVSANSTLTLEHTSTGWYVCHRGTPPSQWAGVPAKSQTGPVLPAAYDGPIHLVRSD